MSETPQKDEQQSEQYDSPADGSPEQHGKSTTPTRRDSPSQRMPDNETIDSEDESPPAPTAAPAAAPPPSAEPIRNAGASTSSNSRHAHVQEESNTKSNEDDYRREHNDSRTGANSSQLPPIGGSKSGGSVPRGQQGRHTPVAAIRYPPRQEGLTVADFLDSSKPLVKSSAPLTKPKGPSFVEDNFQEARKQRQAEQKMHTAMTTAQINSQRVNERKYLKAQYEFEREKQLAERAIYHKERVNQWAQRFGSNPLGVDLVADNERIGEEAFVREQEEKRRKAASERKKQKIKRAIIVKALAEVPLLEEARRQKRELVEEEKRDKALRDVQRVEAIQEKKLKDQDLLVKERQAKLDQRIMTNTTK